MKGFIGVTDNDWFACVTLLKQDWPKAQGSRLTAFRYNWAKLHCEFYARMDKRINKMKNSKALNLKKFDAKKHKIVISQLYENTLA